MESINDGILVGQKKCLSNENHVFDEMGFFSAFLAYTLSQTNKQV